MFVSYFLQKEPDDFNDKCIVLYTHGCNLRCPYCFNPDLVLKEKAGFYLSEKTVKDLLTKYRSEYDYVVVTGGDPALYGNELVPYLKFIKELGYILEMCSNGTRKLIPYLDLCDLIRIDYKCVKEKHRKLGYKNEEEFECMEKNIQFMTWGFPKILQVRTTLHQTMVPQKDLEKIVDRVLELGVKNYGVIFYDDSVRTIAKMKVFEKEAYDLSYCHGKFEKFTIYKNRNIK